MSPKRFFRLLPAAALLVPARVFALENRSLIVDLGSNLNFSQVVSNVYITLTGLISTFCGVLFLIGAFKFVISLGKDTQVSEGKTLMIQSMIGLSVTLGAYAILRTLFYVIY